MKKLALVCVLIMAVVIVSKNVFAYDNYYYPHEITFRCMNVPCSYDEYNFCKNNCTSYAAHVLNFYGIKFSNSYLGINWHDSGNNWLAIDKDTSNDGSKNWEMCRYKTNDSKNCYIKIVLNSNPAIYAVSQKFAIDHARGCK